MSIASFGQNQSPRVNALYLNDVNDPSPGSILTSPSGSIVQPYTGQLGGKLSLDATAALSLSDSAINTLYGGVYMYVQFKAATTAANAKGQIVFWSDIDNYVVTPDATSTNDSLIAGITLNVVSKGNYGFIQIAGKATVLFGTVTKGAPAVGDLVIVDATPNPLGNVLADATAITSPTLKLIVGKAIEAPATGGLKLVLLSGAFQVY